MVLTRISLLLVLVLPHMWAFAQGTTSPAMTAFAAKDYPAYLAGMQTELAPAAQKPASEFVRLTATTIALEKTAGWDGAAGTQVRDLLATSPDATRFLQGVRALLRDDTGGLTTLYTGTQPSVYVLMGAAKTCQDHGYPLAAHCLTAVSPDMPGKRVRAWLSVPRAKRPAVDAVMVKLVDPVNMRMLAEQAMRFYTNPPADLTVDKAELLAFAKQYANGLDVNSPLNAQKLAQQGRVDDALALAQADAAAHPDDLARQRRTAKLAWDTGRYAEAMQQYCTLITTAPSPDAREARLDYLRFLQWVADARKSVPNIDTVADLTTYPDPLIAGDACLAAGQPATAAQRFAAVLNRPVQPLGKRLDAWSGLLDTDPATALHIAPGLLREIQTGDPTTRVKWATWMGWELGRALRAEINTPVAEFLPISLHPKGRPLHDAPNWPAATARLLEQVVAVNPGLCLRADSARLGASLRTPLALAYLQAGQPELAADILLRRVEYQIPPPPGGWRQFDGTPIPEGADQPRTLVTPREGETAKTLEPLILAVRQYPPVETQLAAFSAGLVRGVAKELADPALQEGQIAMRLQVLQQCLRLHAAGQDPFPYDRPTTPPPNLAAYAVVEQAVRSALAPDAVAQQAPRYLWENGLCIVLLVDRDPTLIDGYFGLLTLSLDRYIAVTGKADNAAVSADLMANTLETSRYPSRPDLKPYAQRLRERYPLPPRPARKPKTPAL